VELPFGQSRQGRARRLELPHRFSSSLRLLVGSFLALCSLALFLFALLFFSLPCALRALEFFGEIQPLSVGFRWAPPNPADGFIIQQLKNLP